MIMIILMIIIIIVVVEIIIAIMIMMKKIILILAVVIKINSPFQPGNFSTGSTTDLFNTFFTLHCTLLENNSGLLVLFIKF